MSEQSDTPPGGAADPGPSKVEKLADEAIEAGRKFLESDTGRKVADAAETAFAKAEELGKKALDSDFGRDAKAAADKATETGKQVLNTALGRNVAIGAAIGAAVALPLPFVGSIFGALVGGGIGYLRTITKKP